MESLFAVYHKALKGNASGSKRDKWSAERFGTKFLPRNVREERGADGPCGAVPGAIQNNSSIVSYYGSRRTQLMDRNITYVFVGWQIQNNPKNINT